MCGILRHILFRTIHFYETRYLINHDTVLLQTKMFNVFYCYYLYVYSLSKLQADLNAASQKERDTIQALRDSEDVLAKRRNEINRMRDQVSFYV